MARIFLISYAGYPYTPSSLMPDNGLASLAGCLMAAGNEVRISDWGTLDTLARLFPPRISLRIRPLAKKLFEEGGRLSAFQKARFLLAGSALQSRQNAELRKIATEIAHEAERFRAQVVGLKLWNGDGFAGSVLIAQAVRERLPDARIVAGGPQVDYFGEHILRYTPAFDILMRGEGERALPELADAFERGRDWRNLPGLIWKEGGDIRSNPVEPLTDLDSLPLPSYDPAVYPALSGDRKIRVGVLDESRGCPNRCTFCIHPVKSGGRWVVKSPERVVREMRNLTAGLQSNYFIYSGSNTSSRVAVRIAQAILDEGLNVRYGCFGHIHGISAADFHLLRRSGCEAIFYGLESASRRMLSDAYGKPIRLEEAQRVICATRDANIRAIVSVIYPGPFEDARSRNETLLFLLRARPDSVPVTIPGLIPGTTWETEPERFGFEKSNRADLWEYALTYKIKLLFPPSLWKPLPYRLNGKKSRRLFRECGDFIADLEKHGLLTDVAHEMALMACALGQGNDLRGFRDRCRAWFFSGDVDRIGEMLCAINRGAAAALPGEPAFVAADGGGVA